MGGRGLRHARYPGLRLHPVTLRFDDPHAESAFISDHDEAALPQQRIVGIVAIGFYAGFGLLDTLVVKDGLDRLLFIRFVVVCPVIALVIAFTGRPWVARVSQPIICGVVVLAAFGLDVMPLVATVPADYSRTGTLLILMFLFAFARIRFTWAIATAPFLIAGYASVQAIGARMDIVIIGENAPLDQVLYNDFFLISFIVIGVSTSYTLERLRRLEFVRRRELSAERQRSDDLLHNILPEEIATRLRENPALIADSEADASVLFADIVGFTPFASSLPPAEVVRLLDMLFRRFDDLCEDSEIEKIKTIGDAYMAVAGIPRPDPDHATSIVELAFGMQRAAAEVSPHWPSPLALRIGIASGPVVAGVIGHRKFAYDLWGDTVNTASRMESHGRPNHIQVSESTYTLLRDQYAFGDPHATEIKGKGSMTTYFLLGPEAR
jgi:adenylate cyclase